MKCDVFMQDEHVLIWMFLFPCFGEVGYEISFVVVPEKTGVCEHYDVFFWGVIGVERVFVNWHFGDTFVDFSMMCYRFMQKCGV